MKKLFFTLLLLTGLIATAQAQTERGTMLVGGSGTLHFDTEGPVKSTLLSFAPQLGFFIANNFAIGANIPMQYAFNDGYRMSSIGLGPFARGYFGSSATKFIIEGRGGYNRVGITYEAARFGREDSFSEGFFTYGFGAGATHFLNQNVGLELLLNYNRADLSDFTFASNGLTGISFNLGFQIYLPGTN